LFQHLAPLTCKIIIIIKREFDSARAVGWYGSACIIVCNKDNSLTINLGVAGQPVPKGFVSEFFAL